MEFEKAHEKQKGELRQKLKELIEKLSREIKEEELVQKVYAST